MRIPQAHISGWDEATTGEKLQALYDWCIILTDELRAAKADNRALLERVKKLEGEASIQTGVSIAALARAEIVDTLPEPRTSGTSQSDRSRSPIHRNPPGGPCDRRLPTGP
jgi:hypothetical protein